ncbi:hypothetical protein AB840_07415 [Megasphaera cerevisiae DSM 20462]|uniref:Solute-binding protein family 5 domain-containing protein n=1 Tax=Megasphaera cerevisiae DSM 20462 TaxID=1122219 RepID=A0A0J6WWG7_9FIRM|nr:peptide ABC transporter substrate-binding protein [Megasphaera cerevisiae]KMO86538.1 hypothetical protein AB840_07415 [Megasphaera cerevisiae DSM 20462]SJZ89747.1 peptide/nickel transport system substrate-binding protein [Megasphaera cerevisiae DSM 20462]
MGVWNWFGRKKTLVLGIAVLLGAVMLSGCGSGTESKARDTLTIGLTNAPDSLNPLFNPGTAGQFTLRFMYDTLLGMPEPNKFEPQLADSFESQDSQNFTVKLNPKAKWTDGQPVTADDVVFTLNTIANPAVETTKSSFINMLEGLNDMGKLEHGSTISGVSVVDEHTVILKTKRPVDPNYIKCMLGFEVYIIPKHVFETIHPADISNSDAVTKPTVTSGPFKFVNYKTNDHVELAANMDYYRGEPKLKKIFLRIMNGTNLVTELKSGNVQMAAADGIGIVPIKDLDVLKKDSRLLIKTTPQFGGQYLEFNNANPEFNVHFRRAVTMAINRKRLVDDLYKGTAKIVPTVYTTGSSYYDKSVEPLPYDLESAKRELAQSGFDTSKELTLQVPIGNVLREQSADLIQQDLQALGIQVKQQKLDFPSVLANARKGDYELLLMGYSLRVDPDYSMYFVPGGGSNFPHVDDPKLTDMLNQAKLMISPDERKTAYSEIQRYMRDNQFITSLYEQDQIIAQDKKLKGGIKEFWEGSLHDLHEWHFE